MSSLSSLPKLMSTEPYNGQITSNLLTTGDLVKYRYENESYIGEIVDIDDNTISIHALEQQAEYNGKLWLFNNTEHEVSVSALNTLVKPERPLTRKTMKAAWGMMGYVVGVERYCLIEDEEHVTLDVHPQDSDSEEEEDVNDPNYIHPEMRDFIVPDNEGEAFTFADANTLSGEAKKFVEDTHKAVNQWNNWTPSTQQEKKVKAFVDNMAAKANHAEGDRQFVVGKSSLSTTNPPI